MRFITPVPGQLLFDKAEIILPIPRKIAQPTYDKIDEHWNKFSTRPRSVKPTRHRYKHGYTIDVIKNYSIEVYTIPIGMGQSSIKIVFNPSQNTVSKLNSDTAIKRVKAVRKYLKLILGDRAYTIFDDSHFTRYDLAYDFVNVNINDFHYYMKGPHGDETEEDNDGNILSYKIGADTSDYQVIYYNKSLDLFNKTGDKKWLKTPIMRVEFRITKSIPFQEIFDIEDPFERLTTYWFNHRDPSFQKNFITSSDTNQDVRAHIIELLDYNTLFTAIQEHKDKKESVLNALSPYRVHMYPTGSQWLKQRNNALSVLKLFRPPKKYR